MNRSQEDYKQAQAYKDYKIEENRYRDDRENNAWAGYSPGDTSQQEEYIIRGDMPPPEYVTVIPVDGPGRCHTIMPFEHWVADKQAFRDWMKTLSWVTPEQNIGYDDTMAVMTRKMGVFVHWNRNNACKSKEGWMPVADGMKAVTEVAPVGILDHTATLKAIFSATTHSGLE